MVDRVEIDALLVGALYGELSPAESTRLEAHLSAHPQDRMALEGLTRARQAVRESRFLVLLAEPPPAISAMLLQEAARRAPKPKRAEAGFFAKLFSGFSVMSRHPAMAALAVVVMVAGVAGALYVRGKDKVDEPTESIAATAPDETGDMGAAGSGAAVPALGQAGSGSGDGYHADYSDQLAPDTTKPEAPPTEPRPPKPAKKQKPVRGVEVRTPELQLKNADDADKETTKDGKTAAGIVDSSGTRQSIDLDTQGVTPAPPPQTAPVTPNDPASATKKPQTKVAPGKASAPQKPADTNAAARTEHRRLVGYVKANKCGDAGRVGALIADRYPDYFAEFVANDREVKACKPYVESERKKKAEQKAKSRSQNFDQAESDMAPPSPTTSK